MIPPLEGWLTKAKEAPSPHQVIPLDRMDFLKDAKEQA